MFLGAIIIFGWHYKLSKQTFVKVMWVLFIVMNVANIINTILYRLIADAQSAGDMEKYDRLLQFSNETYNIELTALMVGHWVFASKYIEVVLKLPLLISLNDTVGGDI